MKHAHGARKRYICESDVHHDGDKVHGSDMNKHLQSCAHHPALNVMLIEWVKMRNTKNFAIRVGVGRIDVAAWKQVVAVEKRIILG
jgi:hypothetical protein